VLLPSSAAVAGHGEGHWASTASRARESESSAVHRPFVVVARVGPSAFSVGQRSSGVAAHVAWEHPNGLVVAAAHNLLVLGSCRAMVVVVMIDDVAT
jgi:hypothetical protein